MGMTKLSAALEALRQAGLRTDRSYSPLPHPALEQQAVSVQLHRFTGAETTLEIRIFSPPELGGPACEDAACAAYNAITGLGAVCIQEGTQYDSIGGYLHSRILATWKTAGTAASPTYRVRINRDLLPYVTQVRTCYQPVPTQLGSVGEGIRQLRWDESFWEITVEQLLPANLTPQTVDFSNFTLAITRSGGTEQYPDCRWVNMTRTDTPDGVHQVCTARCWGTREVTADG